MAQVSRRFLKKDVEERIADLFRESLTRLETKGKAALFLDDLLSNTEKIMLAKRLSIAFMLMKGYSYDIINEVLKVSDQTIWNVKKSLELRGKGYKAVIETIIKSEQWIKFWQDLDHFLNQIIPPGKGTNWKEVRRKQWEARRKQEKSF